MLEQDKDIIRQKINGKYLAGEVVEIVGITKSTLTNWLNNRLIVGHKDMEGGGVKGKPRLFSFENVVEIFLANLLIGQGIQASVAFKMAANFSHSGGGESVYGFSDRMPAFPFHHNYGSSYFGAHKLADGEVIAFKASDKKADGNDCNPLYEIQMHTVGRYQGYHHAPLVIVDVLEMFNLICARIGIHPYAALDAVYPEQAS